MPGEEQGTRHPVSGFLAPEEVDKEAGEAVVLAPELVLVAIVTAALEMPR